MSIFENTTLKTTLALKTHLKDGDDSIGYGAQAEKSLEDCKIEMLELLSNTIE